MNSKEKIVQAARDLFYRNGYLATSIDDIIVNAGVSKSNFYYHFKSKEDLGLVVLNQRTADLQAMLDTTLGDRTARPRERLDRFIAFLVEAQEKGFEKGGCPFGNLVAEMAEHSERFRCCLSAMFGGLARILTTVVEDGQRQREFRADVSACDVASLIVQTTQGMLLMTKCHKTVENFGRSTHLLLQLIAAPGAEEMSQSERRPT